MTRPRRWVSHQLIDPSLVVVAMGFQSCFIWELFGGVFCLLMVFWNSSQAAERLNAAKKTKHAQRLKLLADASHYSSLRQSE